MKTMFFIQTHSTPTFDPSRQIRKNLLLHKHLIEKYGCDFFVFHEGIDNLPTRVNYFSSNGVDSSRINFFPMGVHEPRRNYTKGNGDIISIQPGSIKAVINAMDTAMKYGYDKAVYFDHDIQFLSERISEEFFGLNEGNGANISQHYGFPETAFFVINKDSFEKFHKMFTEHRQKPDALIVEQSMIMEYLIAPTHKFNFKGDRFGDWGLPDFFNSTYDYVAQLPYPIYYVRDKEVWRKTTITTELDDLWF